MELRILFPPWYVEAMAAVFSSVKNFLLDLLFPMECLGCGLAGTYLCAACFSRIPVEESFICPVCLQPSFEGAVCGFCRGKTKLSGVIAASFYDGKLLRRLIFACKYRFVKAIASSMAKLILKRLAAHDFSVFRQSDLVIVPVPLSDRRECWRGFNQAVELAVPVSKALGIPLLGRALKRTRSTSPQAESESRASRFENIRGAFEVEDNAAIANKTVILVDDVATTCATISECARVLKKAGAKEIWGLVVAREYLHK
jgi:competence protein ComFC